MFFLFTYYLFVNILPWCYTILYLLGTVPLLYFYLING